MSSIPQTGSIKNSTLEQPQQRGLHNTINNAWRRLHPTPSSALSRETVLSKAKGAPNRSLCQNPLGGVFNDSYFAHQCRQSATQSSYLSLPSAHAAVVERRHALTCASYERQEHYPTLGSSLTGRTYLISSSLHWSARPTTGTSPGVGYPLQSC